MIDAFDYKEPSCLVCGGKEFYYPEQDTPQGSIPIRSVLDKLTKVFARNDLAEAERILSYWLNEAKTIKDKRGELEIRSEQMGLYRKMNMRDKGIQSVEEGIRLVDLLRLRQTVSGAVILLNGATTYKSFGLAEKGIPLYREAEKVFLSKLEKGDPLFAGLYNNMALALVDIGETEQAEACYYKALDILLSKPNSENDQAITYLNLANLLEEEGKEEQIYPAVEKAVALLNTPTLPHDGYHAFVLSKCIPSLQYYGYFLAVQELEKRMNDIYERT